MLDTILHSHGIGGVEDLIGLAEAFGTHGNPLRAVTDAKYLEVGPTGKSDNVDGAVWF